MKDVHNVLNGRQQKGGIRVLVSEREVKGETRGIHIPIVTKICKRCLV